MKSFWTLVNPIEENLFSSTTGQVAHLTKVNHPNPSLKIDKKPPKSLWTKTFGWGDADWQLLLEKEKTATPPKNNKF